MTKTAVNVQRRARVRRVKFGDVVITAPAPQRALIKANIAQSTKALARAAKRLSKPGVVIRAKKGIPLFSLDSEDPDVVIRTLDGKTERGQLVDGIFQAIA
ncbi:hypothetical protein [Beijerinckia indica]|nr:hypothetical protein [Beijerinckia indica]